MRIGFGCVKLGSVAGSQGWRNDARLVRQALDLGVTLFDTAGPYAYGASEVVLGRALAGRRDEATVASKGGYVFVPRGYAQYAVRRAAKPLVERWRSLRTTVPSPPPPAGPYGEQDFTPAHLRRSLEDSLRRLRTDRVDVYQLHGPRDVLPDLIAELQDLVSAGKVLRFGVGAESVESAHRWSEVDGIDVVQFPFGVLDPEAATSVIPAARARGVEPWARGVFGGGLFGGTDAPAVHQSKRLDGLDEIARAAGVDRYRLAFEYVRRCEDVAAVILGIGSPAHLRADVALAAAAPLDAGVLAAVDELIAATPPSAGGAMSADASPPPRRPAGPTPTVTLFDLDMPPAVAFARSLGRAGVAVAARGSSAFAAGRFSRYVTDRASCPSTDRSDELIGYIRDELRRGRIELIAPTSDGLLFAATTACEAEGVDPGDVGLPSADAAIAVLFKDRFADVMADVGFRAPPTFALTTFDDARSAAQELGYPVVLKPRAHVAIGSHRGVVVRSEQELRKAFRPYRTSPGSTAARRVDPDLAWPIVQHYFDPADTAVISVSGFLDRRGCATALTHCRKRSQAPRRLGIGTMFEVVPPQPFTTAAVRAARAVIGSGLFELEVLVERTTGTPWALDLNARAFGQIALDIALGADLPRLWYAAATGHPLATTAPRHPPPEVWHEPTFTYVGLLARLVGGPDRWGVVGHAAHTLRQPRVGAMIDVRDPLPGVVHGARPFRHPRALLRHVAGETEFPENGIPSEPTGTPEP